MNENMVEGRNGVLEAFRSERTVDKVYIQEGLKDEAIQRVLREARKAGSIVNFVSKERLDQISETHKHQGVIALAAAFGYAQVEEILEAAREKGEDPFLFVLDGIEDPYNLGVIIPKRRAVGLTAAAVRASAGALHYTKVAKVTNLSRTLEDLKKQGIWFVCGDMEGESMYRLNLKGPLGLVIGSEGSGVSQLVKKHCDLTASIPTRGDIDSLNASVACGVLAFEILRQRME